MSEETQKSDADSVSEIDPQENRNKGFVILVLAFVALALIAYGVFYFWQQNANRLSAQQGAELLRTKDEAIAYLEDENEDSGSLPGGAGRTNGYQEAAKRFRALRADLPHEILPIRDLAITQVTQLETDSGDLNAEEKQRAYQQAVESCELLLQADPRSALPHLMLSSIRKHLVSESVDVFKLAIEDARRAVAAEPDSLEANYLLAWRLKETDQVDECRQAFEKTYRLSPRNIRVLMDYIPWLAQQQDQQKYVEVVTENRKFLELLGRHLAIVSGTPDKTPQEIDQWLTAAKTGDWQQAFLRPQIMSNRLLPVSIHQSDYKKVNPSFLDFVLHDFSEDFYARWQQPPADATDNSQPLKAIFQLDPDFKSPEIFRAFRMVDFNLDIPVDLVGVTEDALVVIAQTDPQSWNELLRHPLEGDYAGILAADFDRDKRQNSDWSDAMREIVKGADRIEAVEEDPADPDFVVYGKSGLSVLINDTDKLTKVEQSPAINSITNITAATLIDIEADSDLDLIVANDQGFHILMNPGNMQLIDFTDVSLLPATTEKIATLQIVDWDRDVDVDVIVGFQSGKVGLLENLLHGQFRFVELTGLFADFQGGASLRVAEIDGNASWDLVGIDQQGITTCFTKTSEKGVTATRIEKLAFDAVTNLELGDLDNDTFLDAVAWGETPIKFAHGSANAFRSAEFSLNPARIPAATCLEDIDLDGDLDLIVSTDQGTHWFQNRLPKNNSIDVFPVGIHGSKARVNHHGIGSLIELKSGDRYQAQTITSPLIHFGLGQAESARILRIVWTNGMPQNVINPKANLVIREMMFDKGSCPFIYLWNGEQYEFFTDCLWAAPIGLRISNEITAPTRPWEYLKIPGERLKPRDGFYAIQLTEELWEAAYFDEVRLIAVDHPEAVDIFTNEKVGPPQIAQPKIFTVSDKRLPVQAIDQHGRDVLPLIRSEDGRYMQGFTTTLRKGLAPVHYLEMDLGDLKDAQEITLFLTGWIRPSDSSLNIHASQNPELPLAEPPQVYVPDAQGAWQLAIAPMGFPGGKTKTIAVDLSHAFLCDDHRLRIQTSAEIYWDHVFFSLDEPQQELRVQEMSVATADLHYRGFSRRYFVNQQSPELFDYQDLETALRWPPMRGQFTRYGDVSDLLRSSDDQLAVIGAGDEMTVQFAIPQTEPPAGWKRDFILYSVGYDKDADLNTYFGQSSEPLPFQQMSSYPYDDASKSSFSRDYLDQYQTRRQSWSRFWKRIQRYPQKNDEHLSND
jgi:hypothetical protein